MNFFISLIVALIIWLIGYWITRLSTRENLESDEVFIQAPNWLFLLCGRPKVKEIPSGVMCLDGVFYQVVALIMVLYAFIFEFSIPPEPFQLGRFMVGLMGSFIVALIARMTLIIILPNQE